MKRHFRCAILLGAAIAAGSAANGQSVKGGIDAWSRGDFAAALSQWRPLAARGNPDAMFNLGQAYRLGRGMPVDLGQAEDWYTRAARAGLTDAQTELGLLLFRNGDPATAVGWLKRAADKGDARAQLVYGTALYNGDGVGRPDVLVAYSYVAKSAAQGLGAAQSALADMNRAIPEHLRKLALGHGNAAPVAIAAPPMTVPVVAHQPRALPVRPAAPSLEGDWRVQLGAFSQRASAEALFRTLTAGPLAGRRPYLISVGTVTRLQAGPFASRDDARRVCDQLVARRQPCFPVPAR